MSLQYECSKNVARGMRLLNKIYPKWWKKISFRQLNLASCKECVLGQLYKDYENGCKEITEKTRGKINTYDEIRVRQKYGFSASLSLYSYDTLTIQWKKSIKNKLSREKDK